MQEVCTASMHVYHALATENSEPTLLFAERATNFCEARLKSCRERKKIQVTTTFSHPRVTNLYQPAKHKGISIVLHGND